MPPRIPITAQLHTPKREEPVYRRTLIDRFGNQAVKDTVARLCAETSDRIPKFLLPVVRENLAAGRSVRLSSAIVASWARYAKGGDEAGEPIEVVDRLASQLTAAASRNREDALAFVRDPDVFGDLAESAVFAEAYEAALESLHAVGAVATVRGLVEEAAG